MSRLLPLCLLLLIPGQTSSACPHSCSCQGTRVDCSGTSLTSSKLPASFPSGTTELLLHNNLLTTLPNGILDDLTALHSVSLNRNPWVCDCSVLYLRAWLLRQPSSLNSHLGVNCSSPPHLKGRLVTYLTEEELLDSCHYWYCNLALFAQVCLIVFLMVQAALLVTLVVFLKKFEKLSKEARRTAEESFTAEEAQKENEYSSLWASEGRSVVHHRRLKLPFCKERPCCKIWTWLNDIQLQNWFFFLISCGPSRCLYLCRGHTCQTQAQGPNLAASVIIFGPGDHIKFGLDL